jgi:CHAT domain-containing protein
VPAGSPALSGLRIAFDTIARRLGAVLFEEDDLTGTHRLTVVPYGALHYLPFHLMCPPGGGYLVDEAALSMMPAPSLMLRQRPPHEPGALVLAHSQGGQLPHTQTEADLVRSIFGGQVYTEGDATRQRLTEATAQVLHIAAHGEHRLDQPELSYILLGDGQLYTDDLLRLTLNCELVTLSACETGRVHIFGRDEPLGIGRGFLYAGAQALVTSMWPVVDDITLDGMAHFYTQLAEGSSKAGALRATQLALKAHCAHPALWGAFQLIGNSDPLF